MNEDRLQEFQQLFAEYKESDHYTERKNQSTITPVFREIISETLKSKPLKNEHLTGLIQMFKARCSYETFERYLKVNVRNAEIRKRLAETVSELGDLGYTGAGKSAIKKPTQDQLEIIKTFLLNAFDVNTENEAVKLCEEFEAHRIPEVTSGVYSPWLYYIQPEIFPILNVSYNDFRTWLDIDGDYPACIPVFNQLKREAGETDLGMLDGFAWTFSYEKTELKTLDLNGKRFYKISHGYFLKDTNIRRTGFIDILKEKNWICIHKNAGMSQADKFINQAETGDFIYIAYGGEELGCIGKITSSANPLDETNDQLIGGNGEWVYRKIEPLYHPIESSVRELRNKSKEFYLPSGNSTFWEVPKEKLSSINSKIFIPKLNLKVVDSEFDNNEDESSMTEDQDLDSLNPLNLILYGPPGTGKTYRTVDHAIAIMENENVEHISMEREEGYDGVKGDFDKHMKNGQVGFCTFHQSMGYEDFIEGIKPLKPEDGKPPQYDVVDGVFKQLCVEATFALFAEREQKVVNELGDFSQMYEQFASEVEERQTKEKEIKFKTVSGGEIYFDSISTKNNIIVKHKDSDRTYTVSKDRALKLSKAYPDLSKINNIDAQFREIIGGSNATSYWAILNAIRQHAVAPIKKKQSYSAMDYETKKEAIKGFQLSDYNIESDLKYVLIIDEINRGNVAQIFGELITLIEPDKRLGEDNQLSVTLPYSRESFSVPPNLYLIGTMNIADRSVEALDTALRRRFSFRHMEPKPDRLWVTNEGIDLNRMLTVINQRLEVLLDMDHTIGHAWLWAAEDLEGLKAAFKDKILPLLQEFFYNDYEKIGLVLGERFVKCEIVNGSVFAKFSSDSGLGSEYDGKSVYSLTDIDSLKEEDCIKAFTSIYSNTENKP